jgi:AcrR family transcriptional regulator
MRRKTSTAPRKLPHQERAKATVAALLDATAYVLVKDGYARASTNRIAKVAGVNIGSVYQYFPGKDALVAALVDRHLEEIARVLGAGLAEVADAPLAEAARALVRAHLALHARDPKLHRALLDQVPRVERLHPVARFRARMTDLVRAFLAERRASLRVSDIDFAAFVLVNAVDAVTQAAILERADLLAGERLVDGIAELVTRYLAPGR